MSDNYIGHYWGSNPYELSDLEDKTSIIKLRNKVITRIRSIDKALISDIPILVKDAIVTLIGTVLTNIQLLAEVIWKN